MSAAEYPFKGHVFVHDKARTVRKRDVLVMVCTRCKKSVDLPMRTREPIETRLETRNPSECPGEKVVETPSPPQEPLDPLGRLDLTLLMLLAAAREMLTAVEDRAGVDVEVHADRLVAAACAWARSQRQPRDADATAIIRLLLKSAHPNRRDHPTMSTAWETAEQFLSDTGRRRNYDDLMRHVTDMVLRAEGSMRDAIVFYGRLISAERAIVESEVTLEDDKLIAARGAENAEHILTGLRQLFATED